jgi:hypothetical protein
VPENKAAARAALCDQITNDDAPELSRAEVAGHLGPRGEQSFGRCTPHRDTRTAQDSAPSTQTVHDPALEVLAQTAGETQGENGVLNLQTLSRRVLQQVCKRNNIHANMKNKEMALAIHEILQTRGDVAVHIQEALGKESISSIQAQVKEGRRSSTRIQGDEDTMSKASQSGWR